MKIKLSFLFALLLAVLAACETSRPVESDPSAAAMKVEEPTLTVIPLKYAAASELASTLRGALAAEQSLVQIMADERTNSLVVTCTPSRLASVEKLIAQLDTEVKKH